MKKVLFFLFLVFFSFLGGLAVVRKNTLSILSNPLAVLEKTKTTPRFLPTSYPMKNHSFTVVMIGRNNGAWLEKALRSVFSQNYENFRMIYVDNGSSDGSFELARDLIYDMKNLIPTEVIQNQNPIGILENLTRAIQTCSDQEIIVFVDGNDWLAHEWVLQKLNQYYANPNLWLTCGQFRTYPQFNLGEISLDLRQIKELRYHPFESFQLQTFYASLFKKIRQSDLMEFEEYRDASFSGAFMIPMMEMAQDHFEYIPHVLYVKNSLALSEEKGEISLNFKNSIRSLSSYTPLESLFECSSGKEL